MCKFVVYLTVKRMLYQVVDADSEEAAIVTAVAPNSEALPGHGPLQWRERERESFAITAEETSEDKA